MKENKFERKNQLLSSNSRAFAGPQNYIQGPGEFDNLFVFSKMYGKKPLIVIDRGIFNFISKKIEEIHTPEDGEYVTDSFLGESCPESVEYLTEKAKTNGCDLIIGIGGGKALDTSKLVSDDLDLPRVLVPSSAANDNPVAALAVIYTNKGDHNGSRKMKRATELVLADTKIIANAPARLFAAGIADALATWFEAQANENAMTENCVGKGYRRCRAGMAVAKEAYEVLLEDGVDAMEAVKLHVVTEALENVVEANILLSGLGFINTGCSIAHGVHAALSQVESSHAYLHGEKVSFGLVCEMVAENTPKQEMDKILKYMIKLGLPVTLEEINIANTTENLDIIVNHAIYNNALSQREPLIMNADIIRSVIIRADALGHAYKEGSFLI